MELWNLCALKEAKELPVKIHFLFDLLSLTDMYPFSQYFMNYELY